MTSNLPSNHPSRGSEQRTGETEILQILFILWNHKKFIIAVTLVITILGAIQSLLAAPQYYSQATFTLKGTGNEKGVSSIFSQFGGLATQLGVASGNTSIGKIEILLRGHELSESVITKNYLLPRLYEELWDSKRKAWKTTDPKKTPTFRSGAVMLRNSLKIEVDDKKGVIILGTSQGDSVLAKEIVIFYLSGLNDMMRNNAVRDAELNRKFLEEQMATATDPVLVEQLNNLIAIEVQKVMFASSNSLEILELPEVPIQRASPKRKQMVLIAFVAGLFLSATSVFVWRGYKKFRIAFKDLSSTMSS